MRGVQQSAWRVLRHAGSAIRRAPGEPKEAQSGSGPKNVPGVRPPPIPANDNLNAHVIPGGPTFILDALPDDDIHLAIDSLSACRATRRRIILSRIHDPRHATEQNHREILCTATTVADQVILVGDHPYRRKFPQDDIRFERILEFDDLENLSAFIKITAIPGEVILIKAARSLHLERIALDWESNVTCWDLVCGRTDGCAACATLRAPGAPRKRSEASSQQWLARRLQRTASAMREKAEC